VSSVVVAGALCASGCGGAAPEGTEQADESATASQGEALGEASCATTDPQSIVSGFISTSSPIISGVQYSNPHCYLAWVTDINNFSLSNSFTTVTVHDPLTQATCGSETVYSQLYVKQGTAWVAQGPKLSNVGQWINAGGLAFCLLPSITYQSGTDMIVGKSYRIAASARSGGRTVALEEYTQRGPS